MDGLLFNPATINHNNNFSPYKDSIVSGGISVSVLFSNHKKSGSLPVIPATQFFGYPGIPSPILPNTGFKNLK